MGVNIKKQSYKKEGANKNYLSRWEWSINNSLKFQVKLYLKDWGAYISKYQVNVFLEGLNSF
jgi:hypothetical protein